MPSQPLPDVDDQRGLSHEVVAHHLARLTPEREVAGRAGDACWLYEPATIAHQAVSAALAPERPADVPAQPELDTPGERSDPTGGSLVGGHAVRGTDGPRCDPSPADRPTPTPRTPPATMLPRQVAAHPATPDADPGPAAEPGPEVDAAPDLAWDTAAAHPADEAEHVSVLLGARWLVAATIGAVASVVLVNRLLSAVSGLLP